MKLKFFCLMSAVLAWTAVGACQTSHVVETTAWHGGHFVVDTAGVVGRSDIVLSRPNLAASEAMPLGNGRLGVSVWSANGLTAQLNRVDTMPLRLSLGQVTVPGLKRLIDAGDYSGRLNLYNGEFVERGGGMTATVYVQAASDLLVVDVTGADPRVPQTAELALWPPRAPDASATGKLGLLAESWTDDSAPGASRRRFGTLAGITAEGRNVSVRVKDARTVVVSFLPLENGSFRVLVPGPHFDGAESPQTVAARALLHTDAKAHAVWWNNFWHRAGLIKITSTDGAGEYMENLRDLYLFASAAESRSQYPGSQAGIADLFSSVQDKHQWDPAAFWHWNLRMQVAANLGAGLPDLNAPYFNLYREDLANIEDWTRKHMAGRPGVCVPETMRFNGPGIEYEVPPAFNPAVTGLDCDAGSEPYYNARTISTGAEIAFWVWQQYLQTGNRAFLAKNYPLLREAARFLLAYEQRGKDGLMHTAPSNAHETQWDTTDPITDLLARRTLYAETIDAATLLGQDAALIAQLRAELKLIPTLPRTQSGNAVSLLPASADAQGEDVLAASYVPNAEQHNVENLGLEPVWPWGLIGDRSPLFALARRTYFHRPYPTQEDWSFDPIQAARLDLGSEVSATLLKLTERYQAFVNGFASWGGHSGEFYIEQEGVTATALQEALVQDYDGVIRIAPAVPPGWDFDGSVFVRGKTKVDVQTRDGVVTTAVIEVGTTGAVTVRNPWPGGSMDILDAGAVVVRHSVGPEVHFATVTGHSYELRRSSGAVVAFAPVGGAPATLAKHLGARQIGWE